MSRARTQMEEYKKEKFFIIKVNFADWNSGLLIDGLCPLPIVTSSVSSGSLSQIWLAKRTLSPSSPQKHRTLRKTFSNSSPPPTHIYENLFHFFFLLSPFLNRTTTLLPVSFLFHSPHKGETKRTWSLSPLFSPLPFSSLHYHSATTSTCFPLLMGFQDSEAPHHPHHQAVTRGGGEMDGERWVIAGIPLRDPLKPILTNPLESMESDGEDCSTTPTGEGSRIQAKVTCPPPPPRKRKPSLKFAYGRVREFFTPPADLESLFIRRAERAS